MKLYVTQLVLQEVVINEVKYAKLYVTQLVLQEVVINEVKYAKLYVTQLVLQEVNEVKYEKRSVKGVLRRVDFARLPSPVISENLVGCDATRPKTMHNGFLVELPLCLS